MSISILDPLKDKQGGIRKSANWYRKTVADLGDRITARKLMNSGKLNGIPSRGRLNMFFYDPKYKEVLPYYDRFPLVLPLQTISLLDRLQRFATGGMSKSTRIDASYNGIKNIGIAKTTIKKYLYGHVMSSFLRVDFDEAALAVMLPVQQFKKGSPY